MTDIHYAAPGTSRYRREFLTQWVILLISLAAIACVIFYTQAKERQRIETWEHERLDNQARMIEANLIRQLDGVARALDGIRDEIPQWRRSGQFSTLASRRLEAMSNAMPGIRTFIITDADGTVTAANRAQLIGRNFAHRDYFRTPRAAPRHKTLYISTPFKSVFGVTGMNIGRIITTPDGTFSGIVSATLSQDFFSILFSSILYAPDMWITLTHGTGTLFLVLPANAALSDKTDITIRRSVQPNDIAMDQPLLITVGRDAAFPYQELHQDIIKISVLFAVFAATVCAGLYLYQRRQSAYQRSKEQFDSFLRTLTEVIPGLLSYWDHNLICRFANREYGSWFGRSPEAMLGIHLKELLGDDLFQRDLPYIHKALDGERSNFERAITIADGTLRNIWLNYMPDIEGGVARGFYVLVTDVTELKQAQLKLEELNIKLTERTDEAERSNRSKSRLLATVAHEFRTPLSLLTSSTDILDRYVKQLSDDEQSLQHEHIRSAARQMAHLVDSVLTYNRLDTKTPLNTPVPVDISTFFTSLAAEVEAAYGSGQAFTVTVSDSSPSALIDGTLLRRVTENLLSNAFRYTLAGGSISLKVIREQSQLLIEVVDSGIGIPAEDLGHIFETFYRSRNVENRRGLGLGLSIVHEALSHMNGTITVDSQVGTGSALRVTIPLDTGETAKERPPCIQS